MPLSLQLAQPTKSGRSSRRSSIKEKEAFLTKGASSGEPPPSMIGANHRILVVDDNAVVLKAFELKLRADGFNVTTLTEAAGVASTAEQSKAEIIILDINFPAGGAIEWSGFTVLQWLRRFPEVARIPVILITGSELEPLKAKALASGAVEIFQKPVDYQQLLATLLRTLKAKGNPPAPDPASS